MRGEKEGHLPDGTTTLSHSCISCDSATYKDKSVKLFTGMKQKLAKTAMRVIYRQAKSRPSS